MVAGIVFAAFTCIATRAEFVHGQCQCLVGLDAERAKRHGSRHEVLHDALHRFYLVDRSRLSSLLKFEEVTNEDGAFLLVNNLSPSLEFLVVALPGGQLQLCYGLWVPGMLDAVPAPRELSLVL